MQNQSLSGIQKQWLVKKTSSERYLAKAEYWLETGEAVNWIPGEIATAAFFAIEGWLLAKEIKLNLGNGWWSLRLQFCEVAPKSLSLKLIRILSKVTCLEYDLDEEFQYEDDCRTLEKWRQDAENCITDVRNFVEALERNLLTKTLQNNTA